MRTVALVCHVMSKTLANFRLLIRNHLLIAAISIVTLSSGCAKFFAKTGIYDETIVLGVTHQEKTKFLQKTEVDSLIELLRNRNGYLESLQGLYKATFWEGNKEWQVRQAINFIKPHHLRIETLPLNGATTLSLLVSKNDFATILDIPQKKYQQGDARSDFFNQYFKVSLGVAEVISLIAGEVPIGNLDASKFEAFYAKKAQKDYLVLAYNKGQFLWLLDKENKLVRRVVIRDVFKHKLLFAIDYDYNSVDITKHLDKHPVIPIETIVTPGSKEDGLAAFRLNVKVNRDINKNLFTVVVPRSFQKF